MFDILSRKLGEHVFGGGIVSLLNVIQMVYTDGIKATILSIQMVYLSIRSV